MDTAQWPQEIMVKTMEDKTMPNSNNSSNNTKNNNKTASTSLERKIRPQKDEAVNCPRCDSTNTKFCYYNNYSLTQPRYFCKTCKRYWTEGGSLRNIPVGGASRKNKRPSSSVASPLLANKRISSHDLSSNPTHNDIGSSDNGSKVFPFPSQDLNLGFHPSHQEFTSLSEFIQLPVMENNPNSKGQLPISTGSNTTSDNQHHHQQQHHHLSALELLNGLTSSTRGLTPFMPVSVPDPNNDNGVYSTGYNNLPDFKPNLNFSLDGLGNGYGSLQGQVQNSGDVRLLFPFEDLKQVPSNTVDDGVDRDNNINDDDNGDGDNINDSTTGYWSGMLGSGGPW